MLRMVGGASVPSEWVGRVTATYPFAVLTVDGPRVRLVMRWLGRMGSPLELNATTGGIESIYPCGRLARGIGFHLPNGQDFYFFTWRRASPILEHLRSAGFPVTYERGPTRKYWLGRP